MTTNTDELRTQVHRRWQEHVLGAFEKRGWQPPRHPASGGPVPWEEVASTAVEAHWSSVEPIVSPIVELLAVAPEIDVHREASTPARSFPDSLWLSADEVAPTPIRKPPMSCYFAAPPAGSQQQGQRLAGVNS